MTAKELPQGTLEIGLTGGIGSGKSTVSAGLVKRGAVLVDADAIVRDLQKPGKGFTRWLPLVPRGGGAAN